jgi:hypothetical protein
LLRWIRDVIADRGEHTPVPIDLEQSPTGEGYAFRLGVRAGFGGQETARIPAHRRTNPAPHPILKEIFLCEVAGRTLEAANVFALREKVGTLLESIAPARILPLCYFRVPRMDYELPVYEEDGVIHSPVIGGPNLKGSDLAEVRHEICRYLLSAGYVTGDEDVQVGVVRPRDLSLVPPAAVFRSLADPDMWIPSVEGVSTEGEPVVGVLASASRLRGEERRRAGPGLAAHDTAPAAPDVVSLLRFLRTELERTRGAREPRAVFAAEVRPEIWKESEDRLEDSGMSLVAYLTDDEATRLELAIRRTGAGDVAAALDDRGINVFLAHDEDALARSVGRYLHRLGFLRFAEEVEVHPAEAPRAERLEMESIWTFGASSADDNEGDGKAAAEEVYAE